MKVVYHFYLLSMEVLQPINHFEDNQSIRTPKRKDYNKA